MKFGTDKGYVEPSDMNPIPPKTQIHGQALLYDHEKKKPGEREGIIESEFLRCWAEFKLVIEYEKGRFEYRFSYKEVQRQLGITTPPEKPEPRLTAKDSYISLDVKRSGSDAGGGSGAGSGSGSGSGKDKKG